MGHYRIPKRATVVATATAPSNVDGRPVTLRLLEIPAGYADGGTLIVARDGADWRMAWRYSGRNTDDALDIFYGFVDNATAEGVQLATTGPDRATFDATRKANA